MFEVFQLSNSKCGIVYNDLLGIHESFNLLFV